MTGRDRDRLQNAASELGALSTTTFDANDAARRALQERPTLMVRVARCAAGKVRPGGTLALAGATDDTDAGQQPVVAHAAE